MGKERGVGEEDPRSHKGPESIFHFNKQIDKEMYPLLSIFKSLKKRMCQNCMPIKNVNTLCSLSNPLIPCSYLIPEYIPVVMIAHRDGVTIFKETFPISRVPIPNQE